MAKTAKRRLLLISFDAVSSAEAEEKLMTMPSFRALTEAGTLVSDVTSVLLTHTYVVHTSVITGCMPQRHRVCDNIAFQPFEKQPAWSHWDRIVQVPTLYQQAKKAGLRCASVLWPVSAGAKIRWNLPEVIAAPGKSQLLANLKNGSKCFQIGALLRHGRMIRGVSQPELDDFSTAVACDTLRRQKPDLLMVHFTDVDSHKHHCGADSPETAEAIARLDQRLGKLMQALRDAGTLEETGVLVFSDHGMFNVHTRINLNDTLERMGLCKQGEEGTVQPGYRACFWQSHGCAYMHVSDTEREAEIVEAVRAELNGQQGIARFLTPEEMRGAALDAFSLGVEAEPGFFFCRKPLAEKAVHGYDPFRENYQTFYAAAGGGVRAGQHLTGGRVTDICAVAAGMLGLEPWEMDGKIPEGLFV